MCWTARRASGTADEQHPLRIDAGGQDGVVGVRQAAQHPFDRSPRDGRAGHRGAGQPDQLTSRVRQVRRPLAVEVGQQHQTLRTGRRAQRQVVS